MQPDKQNDYKDEADEDLNIHQQLLDEMETQRSRDAGLEILLERARTRVLEEVNRLGGRADQGLWDDEIVPNILLDDPVLNPDILAEAVRELVGNGDLVESQGGQGEKVLQLFETNSSTSPDRF